MNNMTYIGTIQDIGKPYADLYLDKEENTLFLLVRVSSPSEEPSRYAAISVTPKKVMEYMDGRKPIGDVFSNYPFRYAVIQDKKINLDNTSHITTPATFIYNQPFAPQFCFNRIKLKTVLRRMNIEPTKF